VSRIDRFVISKIITKVFFLLVINTAGLKMDVTLKNFPPLTINKDMTISFVTNVGGAIAAFHSTYVDVLDWGTSIAA